MSLFSELLGSGVRKGRRWVGVSVSDARWCCVSAVVPLCSDGVLLPHRQIGASNPCASLAKTLHIKRIAIILLQLLRKDTVLVKRFIVTVLTVVI